jgi:signal recognition particle subunit SRP54
MKKQIAEAGVSDGMLRRQRAIIGSMTVQERKKPDLLQASRKRRIASGAGVEVSEVNRLLKQHRQMQDAFKMMAKGGGKGFARLGAMMGAGGGLDRLKAMGSGPTLPGQIAAPGAPPGLPGLSGLGGLGGPAAPGGPNMPGGPGPSLPGLGGFGPGFNPFKKP